MSNLKKAHPPVRQNEVRSSVSQKHDVNLQKNSTLYFQIGLIVCLLLTYGLLELQFETKTVDISGTLIPEEEHVEYTPDIYKVYEEKAFIEKKQPISFENPVIKPDDEPNVVETPEFLPEEPTSNVPIMSPDEVPPIVEVEEEFSIIGVEQVPIYPGCEKKKTNSDRRKCMSDKINKLVRKKFNTSVGAEYGLSGIQNIAVQFKIDKYGHVIDIKTRAPHPKLEQEAKRVVGKIPQMTPGKQRDKNVSVIYQLPIKFQVQD